MFIFRNFAFNGESNLIKRAPVSNFGFDGNSGGTGDNGNEGGDDDGTGDGDGNQGGNGDQGGTGDGDGGDGNGNGNGNGDGDGGSQGEEIELKEGMTIEVDDAEYTVDAEGNIIDKEGNVFKTKDEAQDWVKSLNVDNSGNEPSYNLESIKNLIDVDILDENGKVVEFEDTPEGIKSYVEAAIESTKNEQAEIAINSLIAKYPFIPDMINYYVVNNGNLEGYNAQRDLSNIEIDEKNKAQQEEILRMGLKEQGFKGDIDNYLRYLESTGTLFTEAKTMLESLIESDETAANARAEEAQRIEAENAQKEVEKWTAIKQVIDARKLGEYEIPKTFEVVRDGKKVTANAADFFNYIYQVDDKGYSRYDYDLMNVSAEDRLNDELLRAYLTFTGGNYNALVKMAANKDNVNKLRLTSQKRNKPNVRITTPKKQPGANPDFGY